MKIFRIPSLGVLALLIPFACPIAAQQPPVKGPPADRTNPDRRRMQEMSRREIQLRNYGHLPNENRDERSLRAIAAQVEEDFQRILIRHNEIARAASGDRSLDYHFVSDASAEIEKRASRLRSRLVFYKAPEVEKLVSDAPGSYDVAQMKDALINLCKKIRSFVTNPVIENPGTVDLKESVRAGQDLERLIELSGSIHKSADRLKKL